MTKNGPKPPISNGGRKKRTYVFYLGVETVFKILKIQIDQIGEG